MTYGDPAELHALVERYLDDPERRRREAAIGRATVLARHTFAHRATTILDEVASLPGIPRPATTRDGPDGVEIGVEPQDALGPDAVPIAGWTARAAGWADLDIAVVTPIGTDPSAGPRAA